MRGPIDFIIVGFDGNKFDGSILSELASSIEQGTINVLDIALVSKDDSGEVTAMRFANLEDEVILEFAKSNGVAGDAIGDDDIDEVAEILENDTSAGLLVIEHTWAVGLKKAIKNANGFLIADGRIHPEALAELEGEL